MIKLVLLSVAAASVAVPAFAETPISFERDGIAYVGSATQNAGVQHIVGHEVASGRSFDLMVARGQVVGTYDGHAVAYAAPAPDRLASR